MKLLLDWLRDPLLDGMDVDGESRLELHLKMLEKKRMLREVFTEFHHSFRRLEQRHLSGEGAKVELGAGVSPMQTGVSRTEPIISVPIRAVKDSSSRWPWPSRRR